MKDTSRRWKYPLAGLLFGFLGLPPAPDSWAYPPIFYSVAAGLALSAVGFLLAALRMPGATTMSRVGLPARGTLEFRVFIVSTIGALVLRFIALRGVVPMVIGFLPFIIFVYGRCGGNEKRAP